MPRMFGYFLSRANVPKHVHAFASSGSQDPAIPRESQTADVIKWNSLLQCQNLVVRKAPKISHSIAASEGQNSSIGRKDQFHRRLTGNEVPLPLCEFDPAELLACGNLQ